MSKTSQIERNLKREKKVASAAPTRAKLKAIVANQSLPAEERMNAMMKLAAMPRNGSKVRIHNRCALTGRSRGVYRKFGISRIKLRELASNGELPGVVKSSW